MNAEELTEKAQEALHFDAHEFDGLRDADEAQFAAWIDQADKFVRNNPWLCLGIALAAGCALASWVTHRSQSPDNQDSA
jgi:ElaB/YqjD/DUF883 family membrane-anchored ribosome-binding protein